MSAGSFLNATSLNETSFCSHLIARSLKVPLVIQSLNSLWEALELLALELE